MNLFNVEAFRKAALKFHSLGFSFSERSDQPVKMFWFPTKYVDAKNHKSVPFNIKSSPVTDNDASCLTTTLQYI